MRSFATMVLAGSFCLLTAAAHAAWAAAESCALPEPRAAEEVPPASREEIIVTSRKLGWVGNQLLQKGRFEEASLTLRDAFNVLIAIPDPPPLEMARLANIIGFTYTMLESYADARAAFDLALDYVPANDPQLASQRPPVLLNYVEMLMRTGNWKRARQLLDEAFALHKRFDVPENQRAPAYVTRGELALLSGEPATASLWLERADTAMAADPQAAPAHRIAVLTALRESYQLQGLEAEELDAGKRILAVKAAVRKTAGSR